MHVWGWYDYVRWLNKEHEYDMLRIVVHSWDMLCCVMIYYVLLKLTWCVMIYYVLLKLTWCAAWAI